MLSPEIPPPPDDLLADGVGPGHFPALEPGEFFVWFGRPGGHPFRFNRGSGPFLTVSYMVFCLFILMAGDMIVDGRVEGEILGFGLYLALWLSSFSALFFAIRVWCSARYALTNRRAIVCRSRLFSKPKVWAIPLSGPYIPAISQLNWDGSGDLVFLNPKLAGRSKPRRQGWPIHGHGFDDLPDVREVERIVHELVASDANPSGIEQG